MYFHWRKCKMVAILSRPQWVKYEHDIIHSNTFQLFWKNNTFFLKPIISILWTTLYPKQAITVFGIKSRKLFHQYYRWEHFTDTWYGSITMVTKLSIGLQISPLHIREKLGGCCHVSVPRISTHWGWHKNGCHLPDNIFKCIFLNENCCILIQISLKIVPKGPINNIPAMVQIMAWRRPGNKPLSEPMMVSLPMHICVARPQ